MVKRKKSYEEKKSEKFYTLYEGLGKEKPVMTKRKKYPYMMDIQFRKR